jgi:hypothetical protein
LPTLSATPYGDDWPVARVTDWQTLAEQLPPQHAWPHRPQLLASLVSSTQAPAQFE